VVRIGPDGRFAVVEWLEVRAALGVELSTVRQRFTINGDPILDLGRVRGFAHLSLMVAPP
jgi:hypothetical protein